MKIYHSIEEFSPLAYSVVTIGTFDGVHVGHQKIIRRLNEIAETEGGESVVLTFFPHPRMVLHPDDHGLQLLNTLDEKKQLLELFGVQHLIIHPFSIAFSRTSVTEYVRDILVQKIGTKKLVIGYDHHFGRNREGSLQDLKELAPIYGFTVEEIPEQDVNHLAVSSTKIREALLKGDVAQANKFSGHEYTLTGSIIKGKQIGRTLGFPTANLQVMENYKLIPANGIYVVQAKIASAGERWIRGVLSIGSRPTFDDGPKSIEVYLLNFTKDLYGEVVTLRFKHRLRDELKFDSSEALVVQMHKDVAAALHYFEQQEG